MLRKELIMSILMKTLGAALLSGAALSAHAGDVPRYVYGGTMIDSGRTRTVDLIPNAARAPSYIYAGQDRVDSAPEESSQTARSLPFSDFPGRHTSYVFAG
jgi:hypothetical protein